MKMYAIILYLVTYLCTQINADAVDIPTGRIFHGKKVTNCAKYPWHALLNFGTFKCGGTLISDKYILTASHCSDACKVGIRYDVYLGSTKRDQGEKYIGKLKACLKNYITIEWDVALLELTKSVTLTNNCIGYLSIYDVQGPISENLPVTAIGFGETEFVEYPDDLSETTSLVTINPQICEKELNIPPGVLKNHLCTESKVDKGQSPCRGDSGGGLIYKKDGHLPLLVGIVSIGSNDCNNGFEAHAKVNDPVILTWIKKMTGINIINSQNKWDYILNVNYNISY